MRAMASICMIMVAACLAVAGQDTSKVSDAEGRILLLENAWNKAEQRRDIPALDQLLAGTLVYTDYDGTFYTKPQFLASVKNASEIIDQLNNDQVSVHAYESSAVVTGVYREKGSLKGKPYVRRGRFTDTWVKQNGSWLCVASQSTLIGH
jgi:ketosteroid isomerase-like protein